MDSMDKFLNNWAIGWAGQALLAVAALAFSPQIAAAKIDGITGPVFNLTAKEGWISTPDGGSIYTWGYANGNGQMQYPGPTMLLMQGDSVTVNLSNGLSYPVSIVFPGQNGVTAVGGTDGVLGREAPPGGSVSYSFVAEQPGTFSYHSGTRPEVQVEMGLVGAVIIRPINFDQMMPTDYQDMDTMYDYETLFLLTEMDPRIHEAVMLSGMAGLDSANYLSDYFPVLWFINGRAAPDTMLPAGAPWLPSQPYNSMPVMHPGGKLLLRVIGGGRELHPFHHHGNHARVIARNGRLLQSQPGAGIDLSHEVFTIPVAPGQTADAIFEWTGAGLGWDLYGHAAGDPLQPNEYAPDHGKPFPVTMPQQQNLTFGGFYSGSPFLGTLGELPPGQGGRNPDAGYTYMWHSHSEKEMTNYDVFPGGMMTMLMIVPPGVPIEH
jgi:manganese oxidase